MSASEASRERPNEGKLSRDSPRPSQISRQASEFQMDRMARTWPFTLMSARMPLTWDLLAFRTAKFFPFGSGSPVNRIELRLELGGITPSDAGLDFCVCRHDLFFMLLDVAKRDLDLSGAEVKKVGDFVPIPAGLMIIKDVEN